MAGLEEAWVKVRDTLDWTTALWNTDTAPAVHDLLYELLEDAICIAPRGEARRADIQDLKERIDALGTDD